MMNTKIIPFHIVALARKYPKQKMIAPKYIGCRINRYAPVCFTPRFAGTRPKLRFNDKIPASWNTAPIAVRISAKRKNPGAGRKSKEKNDPTSAQNQSNGFSETKSGSRRNKKRNTPMLSTAKKTRLLGLCVRKKEERNTQEKYIHKKDKKISVNICLRFISTIISTYSQKTKFLIEYTKYRGLVSVSGTDDNRRFLILILSPDTHQQRAVVYR